MGHRRHRQHRPGAVPARPARGRRRPGRLRRQPRPGQGRGLRDRPWHRPGDRRLRRPRRVTQHRRRLRRAPQRPARRTHDQGAQSRQGGAVRKAAQRRRRPDQGRARRRRHRRPAAVGGVRLPLPGPAPAAREASSRTGRSASRPSSTAPSTSCCPTRPTSGWTPLSAAARWPTSAATPSASRSSSSAPTALTGERRVACEAITENGVDTDAAGIVTFGTASRRNPAPPAHAAASSAASTPSPPCSAATARSSLTNPFHPSPADTLTIRQAERGPGNRASHHRQPVLHGRHQAHPRRAAGRGGPGPHRRRLLAARRPRAGRAAATHRDIARQDLTIRE